MLTLTASLILAGSSTLTVSACSSSATALRGETLAGSEGVGQGRYRELAEPFTAVGGLGGMGTGTLVQDQWVLTAAHVADFLRLRGRDPIVFTLADGREFEVDRVVIHPKWLPLEQQMASPRDDGLFSSGDLALLHLSEPVEGVEPIPLGAFDESNPEVTLVGIGAFVSDPLVGVDPREAMGMERGEKHAGTNRVDRVDPKRNELILTFTAPGEEGATEFEASAFAGDSGGPILHKTDDGWAVIGVMAAIEDVNSVLGDYGDETHATSVGAVRGWIDKQMKD